MTELTMNRRAWIASATTALGCGAALGVFTPWFARAAPPLPRLTVYKDPACQCCTKWIAHVRSAGFEAVVHDRPDMDALKSSLGVPGELRSCHTAIAGKYLVEGHVPAGDLKRLLASAPSGVQGLAVPGMPTGSPGMEMPKRADRYDVVAFGANAKSYVFATHG